MNTDEELRLAQSRYCEKALELGAVDAVPFAICDIVFDSRTLLKCMFGCADWGKNHTCPSRAGSPSMAEYREMFSRYRGGLVIHTHEKWLSQSISLALEGQAFAEGWYFAFSLSDCGLCETCAAVGCEPCRFPKKARPAFHSVGIDVFQTVRGLGLPIYTLHDPAKETQNWYSALFIQ